MIVFQLTPYFEMQDYASHNSPHPKETSDATEYHASGAIRIPNPVDRTSWLRCAEQS
jgi:hypothetical protein